LRADRLRLQSEDREALKAQVFYQLRQRHDNTMQVSDARDTTDGSGIPPPSKPSDQDPNQQDRKQSFTQSRSDSLIYASGTVQTPRSPFELIAGAVIPAALWTGIDSDLPGEIVASVTENVFDSVTGRILLIPQGSHLLGQYDSHVAFGQRRVLLVWTRLTMPDGSSIVLDRIPATDTRGRAGLEDGVDWHWGRIFSAAAVSTLIGVASELAVPEERTGQGNTVILATRSSLQDTVNQVGQELTRRNLDIQPTLTIRAGFPVRAIVNKDLILRPYSQP
jgi:type IV secretion system protein VirB10